MLTFIFVAKAKERVMNQARILLIICLIAWGWNVHAQSEDSKAKRIAALSKAHADLEMFSAAETVTLKGREQDLSVHRWSPPARAGE